MIAVDTNLLVRLLTKDDPGQAIRAAKLMESDEIFIPKTVILETEWVLRHAYEIDKADRFVTFDNGFIRRAQKLISFEISQP